MYLIAEPSFALTEGCKGLKLNLGCRLISGVFEIINCRGVVVNIQDCRVPTLQIDGSSDCVIVPGDADALSNIFTAKSKSLCIEDGGKRFAIECTDGL